MRFDVLGPGSEGLIVREADIWRPLKQLDEGDVLTAAASPLPPPARC